jgi:hypothetical protein
VADRVARSNSLWRSGHLKDRASVVEDRLGH